MANEKKPNPIKISPWWIYAALILAFLLLNVFGGSSFQEVSKLTTSKFNEYLEKGQVQKVIIYNKTEAEVYLTPDALKDKEHKKVSIDVLGRENKGPHYSFDIGDTQNFEKRLESAKSEKNLLITILVKEAIGLKFSSVCCPYLSS